MFNGKQLRIGGVVESSNLCVVRILGMPDKAGGAASAVKVFGRAGVNIEFLAESRDPSGGANVTAAILMTDMDRLDALLSEIRRETTTSYVESEPDCAVVGIYGPEVREIPGVATKLFAAFGERNINILGIATSLSSLCCVVRERDRAAAVSAISATFEVPANRNFSRESLV